MNKIPYSLVALCIILCSCSEKEKDAKAYFDSVISKTDSAVIVFNSFIDGSTYFQVDSINWIISDAPAGIDFRIDSVWPAFTRSKVTSSYLCFPS